MIGTGLGGGEKIVETYDAMNEGGPARCPRWPFR